MSITLDVYKFWLSVDDITPSEVHRIGVKALKEGNDYLLRNVLGRNSCPATLLEVVKRSGNGAALNAWLGSKHCTLEEYSWYVSHYSVDILNEFSGLFFDANLERGKILWKKNDPTLRSLVINWLQWRREEIPTSWAKWFFNALSKNVYKADPVEYLSRITENQQRLSLWRAAVQTGSLRNMSWVYLATHDTMHTKRDATDMLAEISKQATALTPEKVQADSLIPVIEKMLSYEDVSEDSSFQSVALQIVSMVSEGDVKRDELFKKLAESNEKGPSARKRDLLETLNAGELSNKALNQAFTLRGGHLSDPVWNKVASHAKLSVDDACRALCRVPLSNINEALKVMTEGRSDSWVKQVTYQVWENADGFPEVGVAILGLLTEADAKSVIADLVSKDAADRDAKYVSALISANILTDYVLSIIPVEEIFRMDAKVKRLLLTLARKEIGDDAAAWEIFETLLDSSRGSTYGGVLQASKILAENQR